MLRSCRPRARAPRREQEGACPSSAQARRRVPPFFLLLPQKPRLSRGRHFVGPRRLASFLFRRFSSGRAGPMHPGVKVFVGNVPEEASQVELRDLFEAAVPGEVVKVALMKQFAFVHLRDEAAAERAIHKLNGHLLHCHRVVVEFSRPRPTHTVKIFVGNVSAACTSGELRVLFQEFGPVIECDIVKGKP